MVTALFPMRAQPPHIGHVLTIVRIYDDYDKIILRIIDNPGKHYEAEDFIIPGEEVAAVFKEVFKYMPKIEVMLAKEHLRDKSSFDDLPPFDVIVTGNKDFMREMESRKPVRYVPRSTIHGFDIGGTMLRKALRQTEEKGNSLPSSQGTY